MRPSRSDRGWALGEILHSSLARLRLTTDFSPILRPGINLLCARLRAVQGASAVNLYHFTALENAEAIKQRGLLPTLTD